MTQRAFVEDGFIKDLGPEMPEYPAHMLADVPDTAAIGMTWDGARAAWPDPSAGVVTTPSLSDPAAKLARFLATNPDVRALIGG